MDTDIDIDLGNGVSTYLAHDDAQRRRRLRAVAATPATGAYREFLLAQQASRQKK